MKLIQAARHGYKPDNLFENFLTLKAKAGRKIMWIHQNFNKYGLEGIINDAERLSIKCGLNLNDNFRCFKLCICVPFLEKGQSCVVPKLIGKIKPGHSSFLSY